MTHGIAGTDGRLAQGKTGEKSRWLDVNSQRALKRCQGKDVAWRLVVDRRGVVWFERLGSMPFTARV